MVQTWYRLLSWRRVCVNAHTHGTKTEKKPITLLCLRVKCREGTRSERRHNQRWRSEDTSWSKRERKPPRCTLVRDHLNAALVLLYRRILLVYLINNCTSAEHLRGCISRPLFPVQLKWQINLSPFIRTHYCTNCNLYHNVEENQYCSFLPPHLQSINHSNKTKHANYKFNPSQSSVDSQTIGYYLVKCQDANN